MNQNQGCLWWQSYNLQPGVAAQDVACGFLQKADQLPFDFSAPSQEFLSRKNESLKKNYILGSSLVHLWTKGQQITAKSEQCSATIPHALFFSVSALFSYLKRMTVRSLSESWGYKQAIVGLYCHPKYHCLSESLNFLGLMELQVYLEKCRVNKLG